MNEGDNVLWMSKCVTNPKMTLLWGFGSNRGLLTFNILRKWQPDQVQWVEQNEIMRFQPILDKIWINDPSDHFMFTHQQTLNYAITLLLL